MLNILLVYNSICCTKCIPYGTMPQYHTCDWSFAYLLPIMFYNSILTCVEKMSCLAEMSPVGNRIQLENGKVVFKPGNAEIRCRDKL